MTLIDSACPVLPSSMISYFAVSFLPPAYPTTVLVTPFMCSKMPCMPQKQPPAGTTESEPWSGRADAPGGSRELAPPPAGSDRSPRGPPRPSKIHFAFGLQMTPHIMIRAIRPNGCAAILHRLNKGVEKGNLATDDKLKSLSSIPPSGGKRLAARRFQSRPGFRPGLWP